MGRRTLDAEPSFDRATTGIARREAPQAGTTGRTAHPMAFPRLPQGDIISVMSHTLGRAN
jgi:hypothetical protein